MFKKISQLFPFLSGPKFAIFLALTISVGILAVNANTSKLTKANKISSHKVQMSKGGIKNKFRKNSLISLKYPDKFVIADIAKTPNNVFFNELALARTFPIKNIKSKYKRIYKLKPGQTMPKKLVQRKKYMAKKCCCPTCCPTGAAAPVGLSPFVIPVAAVVATGIAVPLGVGGGGGDTPPPPIPEPSSVVLGLMSLSGYLASRKRSVQA